MIYRKSGAGNGRSIFQFKSNYMSETKCNSKIKFIRNFLRLYTLFIVENCNSK